MIRPDYYAVLGVTPAASMEDIRQAFRVLARQYHPDANPSNPDAAARFNIIGEAYRVLSTPQLRSAYDQALRMVTPPIAGAAPAQPPATPNGYHAPTMPEITVVHRAPTTGSSTTRSYATAVPAPNAAGDAAQNDYAARLVRSTHASPDPHATPPVASTLALGVIPGLPAIAPPRELTRFYLLTELGASGHHAMFEPLPLDLALVIDRSSSMKGAKIFESKRAVLDVLEKLRLEDLVTLVFFDDRAEVLADGESVRGHAGIESAVKLLSVRGGTELAEGLQKTLERLAVHQHRHRVSTLVLLTDGRTYGDEDRCLELAAHARDMGISITALGLGTDWNRDLLDRIAAISGGTSNYVEQPSMLQPMFEDVVQRLRATLAAGMRLTLAPAPGVRVARATRIAPDIAEAYDADTGPLLASQSESAVTVELGALVGRPDIESAVVIWELLLDPATFVPANNAYSLGSIHASYWAPRSGGGQMERLDYGLVLPVNLTGQQPQIIDDVRIALELVMAYRMQTQADMLTAAGQTGEAASRMTTAALRLQTAGDGDLAELAKRAATSLSTSSESSIAETLKVKYGTKNLNIFHRLRRRILAR